MIVCPVCEHQQPQGSECDVCGKRLATGVSERDLAIPAVDGLEPTQHARIDVAADRVAELEPTHHAAAAAFVDDVTPDLEATSAPPVDVEETAQVPDLERTAMEVPGDARTELAASPLCRYCRTPSIPGERLCSRCGMSLPVVVSAAAAAAAAALRLCSCGTAVRAGAPLCPACGARLR